MSWIIVSYLYNAECIDLGIYKAHQHKPSRLKGYFNRYTLIPRAWSWRLFSNLRRPRVLRGTLPRKFLLNALVFKKMTTNQAGVISKAGDECHCRPLTSFFAKPASIMTLMTTGTLALNPSSVARASSSGVLTRYPFPPHISATFS